jgi:hypothetical protein
VSIVGARASVVCEADVCARRNVETDFPQNLVNVTNQANFKAGAWCGFDGSRSQTPFRLQATTKYTSFLMALMLDRRQAGLVRSATTRLFVWIFVWTSLDICCVCSRICCLTDVVAGSTSGWDMKDLRFQYDYA